MDMISTVFFWNPTGDYGAFSNWYRCDFTVDGVSYVHTEQYMMAQKALLFGDMEVYYRILNTVSPDECKQLGRSVYPFDSAMWSCVCFDIVKKGNYAKFSQNPQLRELLLSTRGRILAEASPYDKIWGIGLDADHALFTPPSAWHGRNLMGRVLMAVRTELEGSTEPVLGVIPGDITKDKSVDAIVNAANSTLMGGGGVDGAIHRAAGIELQDECRQLHGCRTAEAKITNAYRLPCRYIIHTVGPVWHGGDYGEPQLLAECYTNVLRLAANFGIRRITFPSISTGAYGYPVEAAAKTAVAAVCDFIRENPGSMELVQWSLVTGPAFQAYREELHKRSM